MIALYILASTSDIKQSATLQEVNKRRVRLPKRINVRKSSKRPLTTTPLIFGKLYSSFGSEIDTPPFGTFPKIHPFWYPDPSLRPLRNSTFHYINVLSQAMHTAAGPWGRRLTSLIVTVSLPSAFIHQPGTTWISLIIKLFTSFQIYCFGTCITFLIIIGDQVVLFLKNHPMTIFMNYVSLTVPLRV